MTTEDKESLNEFIRGVIFSIGVIGVLVAIVLITGRWKEEPLQPTKVVGEYKGCEIVQYTPVNAAKYSYFLYCDND